MKKAACLTVTVLLLALYTKAQALLVDSGKVWSIVDCINFGGCYTRTFHFDSDTSIGAYQYKKVMIDGEPHYALIAAREDTEAKQVFFHSGFEEFLMYDFSLEKGDTVIVGPCPTELIVDSVDTVTLLNGEVRKRIIFDSYYGNPHVWIEGIGSLESHFFYHHDCTADIYQMLLCFRENDTLKYHDAYYYEEATSCYYSSLDIRDGLTRQQHIRIQPNPFSDFTILRYNKLPPGESEIRLYNVAGQMVRHYRDLSGSELLIRKEELNAGVYFVQLTSSNEMLGMEKVIIY